MPNLSNQDVQLAQGYWVSSSTQQHPLGTRGYTTDGRAYRYAKAGTVDLVPGSVLQSPAFVAGHSALAVSTTSPVLAGTTAIDITCASSAGANQYAEGYLSIATGTGMGFLYSVDKHAAVSTGAIGRFFLIGEDPLVTTITTTATVSLLLNKYAGVLLSPASTALGIIVGVASYIIVASQFGWIQTWGPALVFMSGTPALGAGLLGTATSGGRASLVTAATLLTQQIIGYAAQTGVEAQYCYVDLRISP
jgi:hypothetical protein